MNRLQLNRLRYNLKTFSFYTAIRFWINDIKHAHERCQWCGWYLHPQMLFKYVDRPQKLTYWKDGEQWVCSKCHYLNRELNKK